MAFERPNEENHNRDTLFAFHIYLTLNSLFVLGLLVYGVYIGRTSEWEVIVGLAIGVVFLRQLIVSAQEAWRLKDLVQSKKGKR